MADYFSGVLTVQRYPSDFPTGVKVAYLPPDRELRIDIDLPLMTAIPELESAEYLITRKELKYRKLTAALRNKLYRQVVAQMARQFSFHEKFAVDIADSENPAFILAVLLAIEAIHDERENNHR